MPKMKLTVLSVSNAKPPEKGQIDYFDKAFPAFGFRIGRSGKKTYFIMTRIDGKQVRLSIGAASFDGGPGLSLKEAREKAGEYLDEVARGNDPRQQRKEDKEGNTTRRLNTFSLVAETYIERYAKKKKRTWSEDQRIIETYLNPVWGERAITDIAKADVVRLLDNVEDSAAAKTGKGQYMANRVLACTRKIFNWAIDERALLETNPVGRKMARGTEGSRKRKFKDAEIKAIWDAADTVGGFKGAAIKMLMLTGQRVGVVAGMRYSEINGEVWTIGSDEIGRSKGKLDHIVPLSTQALALLHETPVISGFDHVFSTGKAGDAKITIGTKLNDEFRELAGFSDWHWQNLRAVVATRMINPLNISPLIIDRIQGRIDQSVLGRHYDANDYLDEKRAALNAWADHIQVILTGESPDRTNVIDLEVSA